ncbi:hypothetical protein [Nocardia sp. XZ_19_385]|uniref:hypothetical protein n=1 Tax=Nocardia sp. XZ_19_385 TaxID=2769488 RepID=UPI00188F5263|nr:hypothetical protein [Nocardia sp. XZ_19_385]
MTTPNIAAAQKLLEQVTARYGHPDSFVGALRRSLDDHPTDRLPRIAAAMPTISLPLDPQQPGDAPQPPTRPGRHALREETA